MLLALICWLNGRELSSKLTLAHSPGGPVVQRVCSEQGRVHIYGRLVQRVSPVCPNMRQRFTQ